MTKLPPLKPKKTLINFRISTRVLNELMQRGILVYTIFNNGFEGYRGISAFMNRAIERELRKVRRDQRAKFGRE